jgi:Na+/H+ antiporter NhaC
MSDPYAIYLAVSMLFCAAYFLLPVYDGRNEADPSLVHAVGFGLLWPIFILLLVVILVIFIMGKLGKDDQ